MKEKIIVNGLFKVTQTRYLGGLWKTFRWLCIAGRVLVATIVASELGKLYEDKFPVLMFILISSYAIYPVIYEVLVNLKFEWNS